MKQLEEKFKNEILENLKVELNEILNEDKIGIFKGIMESYNDFINDKEYLNKIESIVDEIVNDSDEDEEEKIEFKECVYVDFIDRYFLRYYVKKLVENLINLGTYDVENEGWTSEHEEINDKTNYGIIWDNYYDVDTCVREGLSDVLDEELNKYLENK